MAKKPTKKTKEKGVEKQIEELAGMVARGFGEVSKEFRDVHQRMDTEFGEVRKRLDRIENILLASHQNQIDQLRDAVLRIQAFIKIPNQGAKKP